jgi:hypothetical protein
VNGARSLGPQPILELLFAGGLVGFFADNGGEHVGDNAFGEPGDFAGLVFAEPLPVPHEPVAELARVQELVAVGTGEAPGVRQIGNHDRLTIRPGGRFELGVGGEEVVEVWRVAHQDSRGWATP